MRRHTWRKVAVIGLLLAASACLPSVRAARQDKAAQQDKPEPPKVVRKTTGLLQAMATYRVEPVYPPQAMAARARGMVVVEVTISEDGRVISARAVSGPAVLRDAAETAAGLWVFKPTMQQGAAVKVTGTLMFNFMARSPMANCASA